jgi:hypothetical protein
MIGDIFETMLTAVSYLESCEEISSSTIIIHREAQLALILVNFGQSIVNQYETICKLKIFVVCCDFIGGDALNRNIHVRTMLKSH